MIEFTGGVWFTISGLGNVYASKMPQLFEGSIIGQEVKIEGHIYTILGVEKTATSDTTLYEGREVGLLIKGPRKDNDSRQTVAQALINLAERVNKSTEAEIMQILENVSITPTDAEQFAKLERMIMGTTDEG